MDLLPNPSTQGAREAHLSDRPRVAHQNEILGRGSKWGCHGVLLELPWGAALTRGGQLFIKSELS